MKVIDYQIIFKRLPANLVDAVKEAMEEGWQPLGGPFEGDDCTGQALVKYENPGS